MVWYSHIFKNFPQFVANHTVKGFSIVNEGEVDVYLEFSCFFYDPTYVGNLIFGSSAFSKSSLNIGSYGHLGNLISPRTFIEFHNIQIFWSIIFQWSSFDF